MCKRDESLWFKGLKYAEAEFKTYNNYEDGLASLEHDLYYVGFSQQPFCQGVRDYYKHVKNNPLTFSQVSFAQKLALQSQNTSC